MGVTRNKKIEGIILKKFNLNQVSVCLFQKSICVNYMQTQKSMKANDSYYLLKMKIVLRISMIRVKFFG